MVSYTRAKSESLGFTPGTGMANVGVAPREVRLVILTVGLLLTGVSRWRSRIDSRHPLSASETPWQRAAHVLAATLALITILATITTIQRIVHVARQTPPESTGAATPGGDQHP